MTTAEVAQRLGIDPAHVRHLAREHGVGTRNGRPWAFTGREVARLRKIRKSHPVGRPQRST